MSLLDSGFNSTIVLAHRRPIDLGAGNRRQNREVIIAIAQALEGQSTGNVDAATCILNQSNQPATAGATVVVSSGSGTLTTTINGVNVTASGAGTDIQDAAAIATAVNASSNALVQGFVRASSVSATLTLATMTAGSTVVVTANGSTYTFTATASDTGKLGEFSISGNDTADALALATAINAFPGFNLTFRAESVADKCTIYRMDGVVSGTIYVTGSGVTLSAQLAAADRVHVAAIQPGALGNAITFAASGTGVTVANSNTRLVGGVGGVTGTVKRAAAGGA